MSTTTVYPAASSGPDDDVYGVGYPQSSDPSGKVLRESGRKLLNMAKPKTVPKKYIRSAEGSRPRMRTRVKRGKINNLKTREARESVFMEGGPGSGRKAGEPEQANDAETHKAAAAYHGEQSEHHLNSGNTEAALAHIKAQTAHKIAELALSHAGTGGGALYGPDDAHRLSRAARKASVESNISGI